jgi:hypothetical protein
MRVAALCLGLGLVLGLGLGLEPRVMLADLAVPGMSRAAAAEGRLSPMQFTWHAADDGCERDCGGWIAAVGAITSDTPARFDGFIGGRDARGATVVLDSSGGSVLDAITIGRRWRALGLRTTVGTVTQRDSGDDGASGGRVIKPDASCESMCVFLLLSGSMRTVPDGAHVRVHQIWMGDRADDAKAASYTAQDLMIVERDIGRLAKYTFDMGGTGDLLALALSVPPWEPLHELSRAELRLTNVVTTETAAADEAPTGAAPKPVQDRFAGDGTTPPSGAGTRTAEIPTAPTGGTAAPEKKPWGE